MSKSIRRKCSTARCGKPPAIGRPIARTCSPPDRGRTRLRVEADELPRPYPDLQERPESYRDLPMKISEFGIVHRYEPSGALHGIMRVRAFTQDDAHIFCTEDQIMEEALKVNDLILSIYEDFGFDDIVLNFRRGRKSASARTKPGTRPQPLCCASSTCSRSAASRPESIRARALLRPKLEYTLRDAIGREWQCGTTQVDFNMPGRFGAFYIGPDSEKNTPVMIHRASFGSLERFTGISSSILPAICRSGSRRCRSSSRRSPRRPMIMPSNLTAARKRGLRVEGDLRNEKITYKVREHSLAKFRAARPRQARGDGAQGLDAPARFADQQSLSSTRRSALSSGNRWRRT